MKMGLGFDIESNDMVDWPARSHLPHQPHIVQIAAKLINLDDRSVVDTMEVLVVPDGWEWDETGEAFQIHHITVEKCMECGISEPEAVEAFFVLWDRAGADGIRIGHSMGFDNRMIRIATKRYPELHRFTVPWEKVSKERNFDTMFKSKKAFALKKTPKLKDIYRQVTGKEHERAHDAMGDVDACLAVYWAIQDKEAS